MTSHVSHIGHMMSCANTAQSQSPKSKKLYKKKESEISDRQLGRAIGSKENLPNVSNPHQARTKGAPKKRVKNALENITIKYNNKNRQDMTK